VPARIYSGIETPDGALVVLDGHALRMHVWVDWSRRTVESRLMRVQDDGAEIEVFTRRVHTLGAGLTVGPDCLKAIAAGDVVVVHWVEASQGPSSIGIRRYTIDLSTLETAQWTDRNTLPVQRCLHDLQPIAGSTDFITCHMTAGDVLVVRRYDGFDWIDIDWSANANGGTPVHFFCATVFASDIDNGALVVFENTGAEANRIWCTRFDAADGSGAASAEVFTVLPDVYLFQATFASLGIWQVGLLVEVAPLENTFDVPSVAYVAVSSVTAGPITNEHAVFHLRVLGQAFTFAGARPDAGSPNFYALVGYKETIANEWGNGSAWVANFAASEWNNGNDNTVRPRPVATFNFGDLDTRVSGYTPDGGAVLGWGTERRVGCLPHAQGSPRSGRALKTRAWSVLGFAKLMPMSSSFAAPLQAVAATVQAIRFHVEEPWTMHRDPSEPATPSVCYRGENPHMVGALREASGGAAIGGGCPAYYDGHAIVPIGYHWPPEIFDVADAAAGNLEAGGTYLYCATWEWRDSAGQLHRSAPGTIVTHTVGPMLGRTALTIGSITIDSRDDAHHYPGCAPINAVIWRTTAGGIAFHRVYAQEGSVYAARFTPRNDPFSGFVVAQDDVSDADLVRHEPLPYQLINGVFTPLPPRPPPASNAIAKWQNRIWLASSQDTRLLYYSQEILPEPGGTRSLPPEFNPALVVRIDGLGRVIALEPRDQELVLFTSDAIYSLTGFGADGAGQDASYQVTDVLRGVGCIDARSVVSTAAGIFFQSHHGLYCLTGNGVEHVELGAKVLDAIATGGNLRGATYLKDRAAVRWVTNASPSGAPRMLELDLQHLRWSISPLALGDQPGGSNLLCATAGSAVWQAVGREALHVVLQAGALLVERATSDAAPYADENRSGPVSIPLRVRLSPVHLDGINGFVSLRRVAVALEKPNASAYRIVHYAWRRGRYEDVIGEARDYASPAPERPRPYGPRQQRCAAFWIEVQEVDPPLTENLRFLGVQIEVGVMTGLRKE
jgi:hypothetical protein